MGTINAKLITATNSTFCKALYGDAVLAPIPSPLRPLFRTIASSLDHTALEGPHTNNWIDAIIHKLNLINIKSLRDLHLNLDHLNLLLHCAISPQEKLFNRTLDALKLELPNHWPKHNTVLSLSLKHIFEAVAW